MLERAKSFLIGCDGGGTGCRVAIADGTGHILAQARGGPANVTSDFTGTIANLRDALGRAAAQMGLLPSDLLGGSAHFGLAGVKTPQDAARVLAEFRFAEICVTEDRLVAVEGALAGADGVVLALGTGTIIASQRNGKIANLSGWGFLLSDQASGAWLGRALLEHTLLCHDKLEQFSDLVIACFDEFGRDPAQLVTFAATAQPSDYARYSPLIVESARTGDATGLMLMQRGADYLARALNVLDFCSDDALCLTGGLAPHYRPYLPIIAQNAVVPARGTGLDGALRLAIEAAHKRRSAS